MTDDDLVKALRALPREVTPPADLEERIASRLREEGLLGEAAAASAAASRTRVPFQLAAAAILAVASFLGGYATGRTREVEPTHVLLVHRLESTPEQSRMRTREYTAWARRLAGGEKLAGDGWLLDASRVVPSPANEVSGYFLLRTRDDAAALEIAKACPHLRHGGRVELRRIER